MINRILKRFGYVLKKDTDSGLTAVPYLSTDLLEPVVFDRSIDEPGLDGNDLFEIFQSKSDVHKWHHYFPIYKRELERFRSSPIKMLEIGVHRGGSIKMWKEWLHPESVVVGLDITEGCREFDRPSDNIHVRIGDQCDHSFLKSVVDELGPFDLILDDGGHTTGQMLASFNYLFKAGLLESGVYMVEDTHSNFMDSFIDSDVTFYEVCSTLLSLMHQHYRIAGSPGKFRADKRAGLKSMEVPYLTAWIASMRFYDSIIVMDKRKRPFPVNVFRKPD